MASVENDVVDDVAYRWEVKVCGDEEDSEKNQQRAELFRDIATTTAVQLQLTATKIENVRQRRYSTGEGKEAGAGAATTPTRGGTPSTPSTTGSPQVVSGIAAQFAQGGSSQPSDTSGDLLLLRNFLQQEDSSLVNWAPQIHAALGITEGAHFQELTENDINQAPGIPVLQRRRLLAIAKRFYCQQ